MANKNTPFLDRAHEVQTDRLRLRNALLELLEMFEESHAPEIADDHGGDGPDGCSYCEAIATAKAALEKSAEVA